MFHRLQLTGVGPADEVDLPLGRRLNVVTGDNGLGKSFLLEVVWWALTRSWARHPARPSTGWADRARIGFVLDGVRHKKITYESSFDKKAQEWRGKKGRPYNPGLIVYARADGGFCVWDPARNYWSDTQTQPDGALEPFNFAPDEIWDGLRGAENEVLSNGLLLDWALWQKENGESFELLKTVLSALSPSEDERFEPDKLVRLDVRQSRDIPTLRTSYGEAIPVSFLSSGVQRIIALAYLLVWTWQEHRKASEVLEQEPAQQIIFLVDEVEAHLHPRWQRVVLRSLLTVVDSLMGGGSASIQLLAATHSPLVLASLEQLFDQENDRIFHFGLTGNRPVLREVPWSKQGDVVNWLVSDAFGLKQGRSLEAERAIEAAEAFMRKDLRALPRDLNNRELIDLALHQTLADHDSFWPRWITSKARRSR
ncbi:MAG: ATP-binding protein [Myxococcus sp.]|nr:ATP-binding protein [Myxococcus sp.]